MPTYARYVHIDCQEDPASFISKSQLSLLKTSFSCWKCWTKWEGKNNRNFDRTLMVLRICNSREDWMIFRGPSFLAVVWFGSSPTHFSLSKLDRRHKGRLLKRDNLMRGEVGRGWVGSWIMRAKENLVLYKWINTLCAIDKRKSPRGECGISQRWEGESNE